ncbi:hypothetical protein SAMN05444007_101178 [Cribrihabitans marinus]|uniref:Uncharacterized protein n=1 Tax=Cribrihabitans marinus TaxID=1227549 RepID=A0A1H6QWL7_9RHOB|nr:hypothetical protein [Cribrihabitans marinus]GGH19062.1 hypothetical protein GCM10010973_02240 [Cribrihabitans marinus]SEI43665.1 hypothetical protein SAMN05444007_101178 [Cribrihabitans marinus]
MQTIQQSYRGLSLLVELNWDRLFVLGAVAAGLSLGAYLGGF